MRYIQCEVSEQDLETRKLRATNEQYKFAICGEKELYLTLLNLIEKPQNVDLRKFARLYDAAEALQDPGVLEIADDDYEWLKKKVEGLTWNQKVKDDLGNVKDLYTPQFLRVITKFIKKFEEAKETPPEVVNAN